ncbi:MAG: hypothetical protein ACRAVC_25035, partial [Trichormus sp.]
MLPSLLKFVDGIVYYPHDYKYQQISLNLSSRLPYRLNDGGYPLVKGKLKPNKGDALGRDLNRLRLLDDCRGEHGYDP